MDTMPICSGCHKPLAPNAPQGLCPECLIKAGLGTGVDIGPDSQGETGRTPFIAPTQDEVARLFPQLEILGFIGQGGMGAVYRARQKALDRVVALKILPPGIGKDPAFAERFTREAKALAWLNHPGVVTLYEFGQADGLFFFLMEFVDGMSLRHLLEVERISAREALAIVPQICDALQYAHDHGIVHRDIKPENILLDRRGRVKVADFGLAKLVGQDALTPTLSHPMGEGGASAPGASTPPPAALTDAGKVMGTPQYMAPEQREHPTEVDHRADIYSLGVVFYQMLTGELPAKPIQPPSRKVQVDVRLDEVVLRALEKNPELRFQQVSEVKTALETIATTGSAAAPAAPGDAPSTGVPTNKSGMVRIIEIFFGATFTSPVAIKLGNFSALGFLGFLGALGFLGTYGPPGWHWCFPLFGFSGFFGFFGLIGLAVIVEIIARNKGGDPLARHLVVVGRRGGEAVVNWPGVLLVFAISLVVAESVTALGSLAIINRIAPLPLFTVFVSVLAGIAASVIRKKLATPLDKLVPLDEPHDAAGVPPRSLPLFVERDGRWRLYWPGVLLFCGTLGLVVLGVNLAIALVLWLLNAPVRLTFRPGELMLVLMLMAACVIMRLAALKLGSSETARAGSAPKAKVSTARKVIIAFLAIAVAVGSGLVIMLLAYMMSAKTSPPAPTMTSVASPLSSGPAITRVAVGANKAVIEGRGVPDAKFVFQVGKASLKCFFHNDSPFAATIERAWWGRGLNFFVKDSRGDALLTAYDNKIGPMTEQRGRIVFRKGMLTPESDGSFILGEFRPETGTPTPIAVCLEKPGKPSAEILAPSGSVPAAAAPASPRR